ncbi:MAG TPA: phosphoribosyltransferase family protein [Patescibacteria group bacterium]|nr:phosphoribosyltransferase family protein [Patescibacteria group bacterium]
MTAAPAEMAPPLSVTYSYADPGSGEVTTLTFDEFIPEEVVDQRVSEMAGFIAPLLAEHPDETIVVPILAGGSQIMDSILQVASISHPGIAPRVAPVKLSSYDGTSRGQLVVNQDVAKGTFAGKRVFIFDEVVDRGHTMDHLVRQRIEPEGPERVVVVTLVRKLDAHEVPVQTDIVGFDVPPDFLLGRGMDWKHRGRWIKWIGRLRDGQEATYTMPPFPHIPLRGAVLLS